MEKQYDLIVIGGGPGGYLPALRAAAMGKKTALIEKGQLGGTCLNSGCIPTKTYLHTSELARKVSEAEEAGITAEGLRVDMKRLKARKDQVIDQLRQGVARQLKTGKVDVWQGTGRITDKNCVTVLSDGGETVLTGEYILLAAGSEPALLPIKGIHLPAVENSTSMLDKEVLYKRLVIIGGGVIGMEFATVYSDLGCQVTILEAMDRILPGMDKEISQNLKMILKKRGVEIHSSAFVKEIQKMGDGSLQCIYREKDREEAVTADGVLVAVGRKPCGVLALSEDMRQQIGQEKGYILVNENYETSIPGIYAAGDAIGGIQLAHTATAEGYCAVAHMFGKTGKDMTAIPSCVYTDPEIACVGMTLEEAKAAGMKAKAGKYITSVNGKAVLSMEERGFIKLVMEEESGKLLGAQLMCARATDMIGGLAAAITKGLTAEDLAKTVWPHPTFCEGIGEAAEGMVM